MTNPMPIEILRRPCTAMAALALLLIPALASIGCGDGPQAADGSSATSDVTSALFASKEGEPIATIGDETLLTLEELQERVAQQSPFMRPRMETAEGRRGLVDQLVQFELLAREAARQNVHLEPEVQQALKRAMVSQLIAKRMRDIDETGDVSDEQLRAFYEENISEFVQPERVRVSHIFFASESDPTGARARATQRLAELRASAADDAGTFSRQAREHSDDAESKAVGGDLRYLTSEDLTEAWGTEVAAAAFALERVGTISEVVQGEKGYHLLRLIGRQRAVDRKLEDVRPQLVNRVRREERNKNFEAFVEEIGRREGLSIDEELLERMSTGGETGSDQAEAAMGTERPDASGEGAED